MKKISHSFDIATFSVSSTCDFDCFVVVRLHVMRVPIENFANEFSTMS